MADSLVEGYLIKVIFSEANPEEEIKFLQSLSKKTEHIKYLDENHLFVDNSIISLYIISKLINKYHPLIWIYELKEFLEFRIPKSVRDLARINEEFYSRSIIDKLDRIYLDDLGVNNETVE
ncbi:MAG: hypothetical protein ACXADY_15075 [Candidatus Hodarchaeales archaeon]|jgi:hypothetical protein